MYSGMVPYTSNWHEGILLWFYIQAIGMSTFWYGTVYWLVTVIFLCTIVGLGGLGVMFSPRDPRFACSNPAD